VALTKSRADWFDLLAAADVPHGPINEIETMFNDPQVSQLRMIHEIDMKDQRPLRQVGPTIEMDGTPLRVEPPAPDHGEHTDELLSEIGYDNAAIGRLREAGVI